MKTLAALFLCFALAASAATCAWDDDTLAAEAAGLPTVIDTIVGRIAVNPMDYYVRRIEISNSRIDENPYDFEAYDNLAVAYDKLDEFALSKKSMDVKRLAMERKGVAPKRADSRDPWYRYHANLGTVYAHEWIRRQPKPNPEHMRLALQHLNQSIQLNPDAHFGREVVQVKILEMLRDDDAASWAKLVESRGPEKVIEGVVGMMSLGAGADSPELINLIAASLGPDNGHAALLASLRLDEMAEQGKKPKLKLSPSAHMMPRDAENVKANFAKLRKNASEFRKNRDKYVLSKIKLGEHPDTHQNFWSEYLETPRALVVPAPITPKKGWEQFPLPHRRIVAIVFCLIVALLYLLLRKRSQPNRPEM